MRILVRYSQSVTRLYKTYPLVLILCADKVSPSSLINKFEPVADKPGVHCIKCCDYWAKTCCLLSKSTLSTVQVDASVSPLLALANFFFDKSRTLYGNSLPTHPTTIVLYRLTKNFEEEVVEKEQNLTDIVDVICSNNLTLLKRAEDSLRDVPGSSLAQKRLCGSFFTKFEEKITLFSSNSPIKTGPVSKIPGGIGSFEKFVQGRLNNFSYYLSQPDQRAPSFRTLYVLFCLSKVTDVCSNFT